MLWSPNAKNREKSLLFDFQNKVQKKFGITLNDYNDLHRWSVEHYQDFWKFFLEYSGIVYQGSPEPVTNSEVMGPGAKFFPQLKLNFSENLLRFQDDHKALVSLSEARGAIRLTYKELYLEVAQVAARLRELGVKPGDRVAGFIPNISETIIAMLATASLGAVWSSCSPDFGTQGVIDRFGQIKPKILFVTNGLVYGGKPFDCLEKTEQIIKAIPEIETVVVIPFLASHPTALSQKLSPKIFLWNDFKDHTAKTIPFELVPFNHPLYIMYTSGTTGLPKAIIHGAGGTLIQHAKELMLHADLKRDDNITYYATCGWMMWNWLISSLFTGSTVTIYDGSPLHPDFNAMWRLVDEEKITHFGTGAKFIASCRGKVEPLKLFKFEKLRVILSTGSPLLPEDFDWIYEHVNKDVCLSSISGGTDIISCFVLGNPILPVYRGEIQCIGLGMDVAAINETGQPVFGDKGELACRKPFPSMPVGFWNDDNQEKYKKAYFQRDPHIWFHGDYLCHTQSQGSSGGLIIYGRSDTTLKPGGVRIGTAEIYRLVETLSEVDDSIVIGQPWLGDVRVVLFVKLAKNIVWSEELEKKIKATIRAGATPRHVPQIVLPVEKIPYTINGKKVELAVLEVVQGGDPKNKASLADPLALECYRNLQALKQ